MKIKYNIEALPSKLEVEVKAIGENFRLMYKDGVTVELFDIVEKISNEVDKSGKIVNTTVSYEKRYQEEVVTEEGPQTVWVYKPYNFDLSKLNLIMANHTTVPPLKSQLDQNTEIINQLMLDSLMGGF